MHVAALVLFILFSVDLPALSAQESPSIDPDSRVRVTAPSCGLESSSGTLDWTGGDTLLFSTGSSAVLCPVTSVTSLELSRSRKISLGRAIGFPVAGFFVGGITGGLIAYSTCAPCNYELEGLAPVFGAALGSGIGYAAGLVVGLIPHEAWDRVRLRRMSIDVAPIREGGAKLGLRLAF